jgi:hypothetical protein
MAAPWLSHIVHGARARPQVAIGLKTPKDRYSLGASLVSGLEKNDQLAVETAG